MVGTCRGQNVANIFHTQCTTSSSISQSDADAWLTTLAGDFKTRFQSVLPTDYTFSYAKAVVYTPGGGEIVSTYTPASWVGTAGGISNNGSNCQVISWQSGVYWRGGKPRTYFPIYGGDITAGTDQLTAGTRTALVTAANNFRTDCNALTQGTITGTAFGFVSFRTGNAERGTPLFFAITGAVCHPRIGSQRRRLGKWLN